MVVVGYWRATLVRIAFLRPSSIESHGFWDVLD